MTSGAKATQSLLNRLAGLVFQRAEGNSTVTFTDILNFTAPNFTFFGYFLEKTRQDNTKPETEVPKTDQTGGKKTNDEPKPPHENPVPVAKFTPTKIKIEEFSTEEQVEIVRYLNQPKTREEELKKENKSVDLNIVKFAQSQHENCAK